MEYADHACEYRLGRGQAPEGGDRPDPGELVRSRVLVAALLLPHLLDLILRHVPRHVGVSAAEVFDRG